MSYIFEIKFIPPGLGIVGKAHPVKIPHPHFAHYALKIAATDAGLSVLSVTSEDDPSDEVDNSPSMIGLIDVLRETQNQRILLNSFGLLETSELLKAADIEAKKLNVDPIVRITSLQETVLKAKRPRVTQPGEVVALRR